MENSNSEYERYQKAKKQVNEIKGFYGHLTSYVIVLAILIYINLKYTPEYLWFIWTMFGWGIGLFFHAVRVFDWFPFLNKDWEERKIKQFMDEEKNKSKFE
ncbi:MAG: 2TM domain-containing protein [Flavobacterium sp.]|nr:2TM domain-containing protein [Flavobacterium sp.]